MAAVSRHKVLRVKLQKTDHGIGVARATETNGFIQPEAISPLPHPILYPFRAPGLCSCANEMAFLSNSPFPRAVTKSPPLGY